MKKLFTLFLLSLTAAAVFSQPQLKLVRNGNVIVSNSTLGLPSAAAGSATTTLVVLNNGASSLSLTGSPVIGISGANAADFSITPPPITTLAPGQSTIFVINYTPSNSGLGTAQLSISSDDPSANPYLLNLVGPGNSIYGPQYPPIGTVTTDVNGEAGRSGGRNVLITNVSLSAKTNTYWGPQINAQGELQLKVSLDGGTYTDGEILTFDNTSSSLSNGKAIWRGTTKIQNAIDGLTHNVYIRATLTTTRPDNSVVSLVDPTSLGLSEQVGGLVKFNSLADYLVANYFIEASLSPTSGFTPYLDFYDAYPTPPGPLPGQGIGAAYSSIGNGFYWNNLLPRVTTNAIFDLDEGATKVISASYLNVTDDEDLPANPQNVVFEFKTVTSNDSPLAYNVGVLKKNGTIIKKSNVFSLKDIQDGLITYSHDGSETVYDEFQFSVKDSKGAYAKDGAYTVYSFRIQVTPVNDPPIAADQTLNASNTAATMGTLVATDAEGNPLTFKKLSDPTYGTVTLNTATGEFTYIPNPNQPSGTIDSFIFTANDGAVDGNTATVSIKLINLPPTTLPVSISTREGKSVEISVSYFDPENETPATYVFNSSPTKGSIVTNDFASTGKFTYQPNSNLFGQELIYFSVKDPSGNVSTQQVITIDIAPSLDEGDILITDGSRLRLVNPSNGLDATLVNGGLVAQAQNVYFERGTSIFVLDDQNGIVKINPTTFQQTQLSNRSNFAGSIGMIGVALSKNGNLAVSTGNGVIYQVDTLSGATSTLFSGGNLVVPTGLAYLKNGDLLVADATAFGGGTSKVIRITPSGTQSIVSSGGSLEVPVDIAINEQGSIWVGDGGGLAGGSNKILSIQLADGTQSLISKSGDIGFPSGIDYQRNLKKLYVLDQDNKKLLSLNTTDGTKTTITTSFFLLQPFGVAVVQKQNLAPAISTIPAVSGYYGKSATINLYDYVSDDNDLNSELDYKVTNITSPSVVAASIASGVLTLNFTDVGNSSLDLIVTDTNGKASKIKVSITVNKNVQTITFATLADKTYGDNSFALSASASSGLAITYTSSNTDVATISGSTVTIVGAGTTTITATQAGNASYSSADDVSQTLTVNKASQTITFSSLVSKTFGDAAFNLTANGGQSGKTVTYASSNTSVATISGNTITIVGTGSTTITASQAGNSNYSAADDVSQTLTVNKAGQTITFGSLPSKTFGDASFNLSATTSSNLTVSYAAMPSDKVTISGNTVTLVKAGFVTITATQAGNTNFSAATAVSQSICINPAKPIVTLSNGNTSAVTLTSSAASGNQWYLAGTAIANATGSTLSVTKPGIYKVQVAADDCLSEFSADQPIIITGDIAIRKSVSIYPNPTSDYINVESIEEETGQAQVLDMTGRSSDLTLSRQGNVLVGDIHHLPAGVYILRINSASIANQLKFIKL